MKYLLFSFLAGGLSGCAADYKALVAVPIEEDCAAAVVPHLTRTSWYHASIEVTGKHISGLLLIKTMPDSTQRVVFTNEAGITFFDFGFSHDDFKVYTILRRLNRQPVVQTLRKDFELVLGLPFRQKNWLSWTAGQEIYFGTRQGQQTAYFVTDEKCTLTRLEWGSKRKRRVSVSVTGHYPAPEKIELIHHTFSMQIALTRLEKE
jgi:hypothetical protein